MEQRGAGRSTDGPQRVPFCSVHKFFTTFEKTTTMAIKLILPATNYATPPLRRPLPPAPAHSPAAAKKTERESEKGRETANKITHAMAK